jgi:hypothetical protein
VSTLPDPVFLQEIKNKISMRYPFHINIKVKVKLSP